VNIELNPPFKNLYPINTDKLVWIAGARFEYINKMQELGIQFSPSTFRDIDESLIRGLNLPKEELRHMQMIGSWIIQDREWQLLTQEEKEMREAEEEQLMKDLDEDEELPEEMQQLSDDMAAFFKEKINEKETFENLVKQFGETDDL
jgi:hypothetical protein